MSLRYRLFLWVSGLFLVAAIGALFMESYVTRREMKNAQEELRSKILNQGEERRKDLQNFLASTIAQKMVLSDAVLNNLSLFKPQIERFGPTLENLVRGTWKPCADLLMDFKWIDFLQSSNQGRPAATIIPNAEKLLPIYRIDGNDGVSWVYIKGREDPYLAVHVPLEFISAAPLSPNEKIVQNVEGVVPRVFFFFDPKKMEQEGSALQKKLLDVAIPVSWAEGYELKLPEFVEGFEKVQALAKEQLLRVPHLDLNAIEQKMHLVSPGLFNLIPSGTVLSTMATEQYMQGLLENTALRFLQINMIWMAACAYESGIFGSDIFSFPSPEGIGLFSMEEDVGLGFEIRAVLFPETVFNDEAYFTKNPPINAKSHLGSSLAVITSADNGHVYLGNTVDFNVKVSDEERKGLLTIGVDADEILQQLVLALHQMAFLVSGDQIQVAFDVNGQKMTPARESAAVVGGLVDQKSGEVMWNNESYYFFHMKPFPNVDLHFFLLNPTDVQFALLHDLEAGSEQVIKNILFNIHAIGLFALGIAILLLHNISRRITRPIVELARASKEVAYGRLDQIKITLPPLKYNDEIAVLCHSFEEMVKGLVEKEKVKGVLNKVVSPEIAQEILRGNIHLGGEEKKVTVLFADIRNFTKISQHMPPQQVIELLNTCMTKISFVIDKHSGVIDKYVGDEAMALFGAPLPKEDSALCAIRAAIEMLAALKEWNVELKKKNEPLIEMGISIHTGVMLAGNMGAENRLNYTVLGSNVNLASRLCSFAKRMEILITRDTLFEPMVKESILYETLGPMEFKGFDQPVEVFRVIGLVNAKSD